MQIIFLRNATLIIEVGGERILVDPMLGEVGSLPPYAFFRHKPRFNPTVPLPSQFESSLDAVTIGLITHCRYAHFDHLDKAGWRHLTALKIPVYCNELDERYLRNRGINTHTLKPGKELPFLGGTLLPVIATHGYGLVGKLMGPGLGYVLSLPGEPTLYISGDTVLTPSVRQVLTNNKPDIAILAAGAASLDIGKPILMPFSESIEFVRIAPGQVVATHMEALNHCPITRDQFREAITQEGLAHKVCIPFDGERLAL